MDLIEVHRGPELRLRPKSRYGECDFARAVASVFPIAVHLLDPVPVFWRGFIVGLVWGDGRGGVYAAPFGSLQQINAAVVGGKAAWTFYSKGPNGSGGFWYDYWPLDGVPEAGDYTGSAATFVRLDNTTPGAMNIGGSPPSGSTKYLLQSGSKFLGATTPASSLLFGDRVGHYPSSPIVTGTQSMTNALSPLRWTTGGMRIVFANQGGTGATPSNLTRIDYVNQSGASKNITFSQGIVVPTGFSAVSGGIPANIWSLAGPFVSLAAGDYVQTITSYVTSAANTGSVCFALFRPLALSAPSAVSVATNADAFRSMIDGNRLYDGTCVNAISYVPAANVTAEGVFDTVYS